MPPLWYVGHLEKKQSILFPIQTEHLNKLFSMIFMYPFLKGREDFMQECCS